MILNCILVSGVKDYRSLHVGLVIIFGSEWDEVTKEWRKLHSEELNDLYSSPNIVRVVKPRRMRWEGARSVYRGEERRIQGFGGGTLFKQNLEPLGYSMYHRL